MLGGNPRRCLALICFAACTAGARAAWAGAEAWRVNEVGVEPGTPVIRYVELYAPPSASVDNCFFPSTRLEVFDAAGGLIGTATPFQSTVCFNGDTYFLFATPQAAAQYGVDVDAALMPAIPAGAGQVCFRASTIRYDCVRWGTVTGPVVDQGAPGDVTSAPAMVSGMSLERVGETGVVVNDWQLGEPTPRGPNDGSAWFPVDAGPVVDAGDEADARVIADAGVFVDAEVSDRPDARTSAPGFLQAEPGGGAGCGCRVGATRKPSPSPSPSPWVWIGVAVGLRWGARRRRGAPRA